MKIALSAIVLAATMCAVSAAPAGKRPTKVSGEVEVCSGVWADATGKKSASAALQKCLDSKEKSRRIELPRGTYRIDKMLVVKHSDTTITTRGLFNSTQPVVDDAKKCAVFKAAPNFDGWAMLRADETIKGLVFDHVNFDGNRLERLEVAQAMRAKGTGRNVLIAQGDGTQIRYCGFYRAACGTAVGLNVMQPPAKNVLVTRSVFNDNGRNVIEAGRVFTFASLEALPEKERNASQAGLWADGLTIGFMSDSEISHNEFRDNSDVSLILGGGVRTRIHHNIFKQTWQRAFAAFMLTNWTGPAEPSTHRWADFRGLTFEDNEILLPFPTDIGIQAGVLMAAGGPYVANLRTMGGTFRNNTIETSGQGINIGGGGTPDAPVVLRGNNIRITGKQGPAGVSRIITDTSQINVQNPGADSFASGDIEGATSVNWNSIF